MFYILGNLASFRLISDMLRFLKHVLLQLLLDRLLLSFQRLAVGNITAHFYYASLLNVALIIVESLPFASFAFNERLKRVVSIFDVFMIRFNNFH
jgi:hypothetical protein